MCGTRYAPMPIVPRFKSSPILVPSRIPGDIDGSPILASARHGMDELGVGREGG